ncbi:MAG: hypothetical protein NTY32_10730 [Bacteroidia bacterium]|nr:hypothetical protein [Bacteroidia bacterium]
MKLKELLIIIVVISFTAVSCAYDDSYLDAKLPKNMAYFASLKDYTRTVVVGEGLRFKIGAAMAGELTNNADRTVDFKLGNLGFLVGDTSHVALPTDYYNYSSLVGTAGTAQALIPKGSFIGYFSVELDSTKFLNDANALKGKFTIPVKIVGTSLDSINSTNDSVTIMIRYIAGIDGYYLYKNTIQKEINGANVGSPMVENFANESDNSAWRLLTKGPFTVEVTSAIAAKSTSGMKFNLTVDGSGISYQSIAGQATVQAESTNTYDKTTRDFNLNYRYKKTGNDTIYHVNSNLIFRNRVRDGINEPRDYLNRL